MTIETQVTRICDGPNCGVRASNYDNLDPHRWTEPAMPDIILPVDGLMSEMAFCSRRCLWDYVGDHPMVKR